MKIFKNIVRYFQEVRLETAKVTWPTRTQTIRLTLIVVIGSVLIGIFVGGLDYIFVNLLSLALPS